MCVFQHLRNQCTHIHTNKHIGDMEGDMKAKQNKETQNKDANIINLIYSL